MMKGRSNPTFFYLKIKKLIKVKIRSTQETFSNILLSNEM